MPKPAIKVDELSTEDRLRLLEELWDSLITTPGAVPLTPAQRQELDRRLDEVDQGELDGIPWDEVVRQIRSRAM